MKRHSPSPSPGHSGVGCSQKAAVHFPILNIASSALAALGDCKSMPLNVHWQADSASDRTRRPEAVWALPKVDVSQGFGLRSRKDLCKIDVFYHTQHTQQE